VFRARGLTKAYGPGQSAMRALRDVDLDVFSGEFLVLLGPSGTASRRSSTSWAASTPATSGSVSFLDHDLTVDYE
jgi:putative ABC transport system ATP-binding protein